MWPVAIGCFPAQESNRWKGIHSALSLPTKNQGMKLETIKAKVCSWIDVFFSSLVFIAANIAHCFHLGGSTYLLISPGFHVPPGTQVFWLGSLVTEESYHFAPSLSSGSVVWLLASDFLLSSGSSEIPGHPEIVKGLFISFPNFPWTFWTSMKNQSAKMSM